MALRHLSFNHIRYAILRAYARRRLGIRRDEALTYNTTKRIMLTFDDYGTEANIRSILTLLRKERIRAFFFIQGDWAQTHPELVELITREGHWLGNHSYSHARLSDLPDDELQKELANGLQTKVMRPPYGAYNNHVRQIAKTHGFRISFWTIDSWDWKGITAKEIERIVLAQLHPGACILLHLNADHTLEALPGLIAGIRTQGYELCSDGTEVAI